MAPWQPTAEWMPVLILLVVGLVLVWCVCTKGLQSVDALYDQQHLDYTYRLRGSLWSLRTRSTIFPRESPMGVAQQAWYDTHPTVTPQTRSMAASRTPPTPPGVFQPVTHVSWSSQGDVRVWAGIHSPQTADLLRNGSLGQRLNSAPPVLFRTTPKCAGMDIPAPVTVRIEPSPSPSAEAGEKPAPMPAALGPSQVQNLSAESASSVTPLLP